MGQLIGKRVPPIDGLEKVTGAATYAFDIEIPGMVYVKLVTSPYAHARILNIKYEEALKVPGVIAVFTGKDFPFRFGIYVGDRDMLAIDKVLWKGHPVAAVVAETLEAAERAIELVEVEYEELPGVFDVEEAKKPDAPIIHEKLGEYRVFPGLFRPVPGTNQANTFKLRKGDVKEGFAKADIVVEDEFFVPFTSHSYMETQNVVAWYKVDGSYEIWTSTQSPFAVRNLIALSLNIPINKIIVHHLYTGGGFGGKAGIGWEPLAMMISQKLRRPVRVIFSRAEQFSSSLLVDSFKAKAKMGVTKDGRIVAYEVRFLFDCGAFADYTVNVSRTAGYMCGGPYDIDNIYCESTALYTNKVPTTAFRGFGHPENHFVLELMVEKAAKAIGMDPVEFRLKNLLKPGKSTTCTGAKLREDAGRPDLVIKAAAEAIEWGKEPEQPKEPWKVRAKALAALVKGPSQPPNASSSAIIKFNEDATIDVMVGTGNMGQGTVTSLAMIVADAFGIPIEKVRVAPMRSTDSMAYTWQTVGSRGLFTDGQALLMAIEDAKEQIKEIAAQVLVVRKEDLDIKDGKVYVIGKPWYSLSLEDLIMGYMYPSGNSIGGPIIGRGYHIAELCTILDPESGQGSPTIFYTFGATGVEVEVDVLTGEVKILRASQVYDVGKAINPMLLEGQTIGGFVMGMSRTIFEEVRFDEDGNLLNPNFSAYYVARAKDVPEEIKSIFIETPQHDGPHGARGIGEMVMIAVAPAIVTAVNKALGLNITSLPLTRERLAKLIKEQRPELIERALKALKVGR